jgi:hypothetical protein
MRLTLLQRDQFGRNFAFWPHFSVVGRIFLSLGALFLKNVARIIWAKIFSIISPKVNLNKLYFWLLFVLKIPQF